MEREKALEIIKYTQQLYPNMKLTDEIVIAWRDILERCNYERTMKRLKHYYAGAKFAPHISDIAEYEQINEAQLNYDEIQRDIEANRSKPRDPEIQARVQARIKRIREKLNNE